MSDAGGTEDTTDYSKMKVNDLKKILKTRGLSLAGNKQELIDRLSSAEAPSEDLLDGSEVGDELVEDEDLERELDESALLIGDEMEKAETKKENSEKPKAETKEEPASSSPSKVATTSDVASKPVEDTTTNSADGDQPEVPNTTQQKRKISLKPESSLPNDAAKKKLRAERFSAGGEASAKDSKDLLAKRAERFAINSTTTSTAVSDKTKLPPVEALKKRAERFGILSPAEQKKKQLEKLQARKLRFSSGGSTAESTSTTATATIAAVPVLPSGVKPTQLSVEERKKLRAQRFNNSK